MESNNFKSVLDSCPTIIVEHPDSVFFPRTITVDYGDGECDNIGTITDGVEVWEIILGDKR